MKRLLLALFSVTAFAGVSVAQQPTTFKQLNEVYQQQYKRIQSERKVRMVSSGEKYTEMLAKLEKGFQVAGQFEPMTAVKKENERWTKTASLMRADVVNTPAELRSVQEGFLKTVDALNLDTSKNLLALGGQYKNRLVAMQSSLTKAGRVNEATAVNRELKTLLADPTMAKARRMVDGAKASSTAAAATADTKPEPAVSTSRSFKGSDANRIEKRYDAFFKALGDKDPKTATELVDPAFVQKVGMDGIKPRMSILMGVVGTAKALGVTFKKGVVTLNETKTEATIVPILVNPFTGESKGDPSHWKLVEGDWYIDMEKDGAARPQAVQPGGQADKFRNLLNNRAR